MKELHKWFDQAANYCASKKFEEAKRILNSITSVYPEFSEGYRLLGQIQYEDGLYYYQL